MAMLFSQSVSSALEALTISEMKDGQLCCEKADARAVVSQRRWRKL
jgi:hypothetical protein